MKLTMWRVVVVFNTHTKFRENRPFHHPYPEERQGRRRATASSLRSILIQHDFFRENRIQSLNKHARLVEYEVPETLKPLKPLQLAKRSQQAP